MEVLILAKPKIVDEEEDYFGHGLILKHPDLTGATHAAVT
jgi:hypothetical protein